MDYPTSTKRSPSEIAGSAGLFFADTDFYLKEGEERNYDPHVTGAVTIDLSHLVQNYKTFMAKEGASAEKGFEGFKASVTEYISSLADKRKDNWKEILNGLDEGEFRYALNNGFMPMRYDFSFAEDFTNGIGTVVENVNLDLARLRSSDKSEALEGVSNWLNNEANGYQKLGTAGDLEKALKEGDKLPDAVSLALADDMTVGSMAQSKFAEAVAAYYTIKADEKITDKNEALAEQLDYISFDRMGEIISRFAERGLVPAPDKATADEVTQQWERATVIRETWPSPQEKNYPRPGSEEYSREGAQLIYFRGAELQGESVLTIGENAVKPTWPSFNGTTDETKDLSTWIENGKAFLDASELEPGKIAYNTPNGTKHIEITQEDIDAGQKQIPSEALILNKDYNYPIIASVGGNISGKELSQQLDKLIDKTENPAVYTGFGNGACVDQAAEAMLPSRLLSALHEKMGAPDPKVNALERFNDWLTKARDNTTQSLPQGMVATDHSKRHPFNEQDPQGYDSALHTAHQQSRTAQAHQQQHQQQQGAASEQQKNTTFKNVAITLGAAVTSFALAFVLGRNQGRNQGGEAMGRG